MSLSVKHQKKLDKIKLDLIHTKKPKSLWEYLELEKKIMGLLEKDSNYKKPILDVTRCE